MAERASARARHRPLRFVGIPLAGVFLVLFFIYLGFPYDKAGDRIVSELQRSSGVRVDFQKLGPSLHLAGPGIAASGVRATLSNGDTYEFARAMLRPAWSLSWFRGQPALYAEIESDLGNAEGTLILGEAGGWSGDLEEVDTAKLPLSRYLNGATLTGRLDASADIRLGEQGPTGPLVFSARDGSFGIEGFPVEIPYETLSGDLRFGDDAFVEIKRLNLQGPLLTAEVKGSVLQAPTFRDAPLRLEVELEAKRTIVGALRSFGIRIGRGGKTKTQIAGTVGKPDFR